MTQRIIITAYRTEGERAWRVEVIDAIGRVTIESDLSTLPAARSVAADFRADYMPPTTAINVE